jgi:hypothetical protein
VPQIYLSNIMLVNLCFDIFSLGPSILPEITVRRCAVETRGMPCKHSFRAVFAMGRQHLWPLNIALKLCVAASEPSHGSFTPLRCIAALLRCSVCD